MLFRSLRSGPSLQRGTELKWIGWFGLERVCRGLLTSEASIEVKLVGNRVATRVPMLALRVQPLEGLVSASEALLRGQTTRQKGMWQMECR